MISTLGLRSGVRWVRRELGMEWKERGKQARTIRQRTVGIGSLHPWIVRLA